MLPKLSTSLTLLSLAATALGTSARAEDITLRVADFFPANHFIVAHGTKPWMEEVTRLTNGKVQFKYYPSEQLGKAKDMLSLTQSGVTDIGYVAPAFVTDKLPLATVAELPESFSTSCAGTMAYWQLVKSGGLLDQKDYGPAGVRVLWTLVVPPYQLYMARDPITSIDVVKGKKLRTTGAAKELAVRKLGGVPVQIPTPDVMEALSRGTVDGMLFLHSSIISYDLARYVKSATLGENFGSFVVVYLISKRKWDQLPADVKAAFDAAGEKINREMCKYADDAEPVDVEKLKAAGVNFVTFSPEEKAKVREMLSGVGAEWAANLDKRHLAGTPALEAFRKALAENPK